MRNSAKIRRLYEADAQGVIDETLIDEVGWALWERCDSILTVSAAHQGHIRCPACRTVIETKIDWSAELMIVCPNCGWQLPWITYHQTYQGKQLFGANAMEAFTFYLKTFPQASTANEKMFLIDQLIHAFHISLQDIGRPAAVNLIEGKLKDVIFFLDKLTNGNQGAGGIDDSRTAWRSMLEAASWSEPFIPGE